MTLSEALDGISVRKYYKISGYKYTHLNQRGHGDLKFEDLNPSMQRGILEILHGVFRVSKMVFSYDLGYVTHCMKDCGIKVNDFYKDCDISKSFHINRNLTVDTNVRLMKIRVQLLVIVNRLFDYVLE